MYHSVGFVQDVCFWLSFGFSFPCTIRTNYLECTVFLLSLSIIFFCLLIFVKLSLVPNFIVFARAEVFSSFLYWVDKFFGLLISIFELITDKWARRSSSDVWFRLLGIVKGTFWSSIYGGMLCQWCWRVPNERICCSGMLYLIITVCFPCLWDTCFPICPSYLFSLLLVMDNIVVEVLYRGQNFTCKIHEFYWKLVLIVKFVNLNKHIFHLAFCAWNFVLACFFLQVSSWSIFCM